MNIECTRTRQCDNCPHQGECQSTFGLGIERYEELIESGVTRGEIEENCRR